MSWQWRKLFDTVHANNVELLDAMLNADGWPMDTSCTDFELLILATKLGRKKIVHYLLDKNCRVYFGSGHNTPLHYAVRHRNWNDVIERLLAKGLRMSDTNRSGKTALHVAFKLNVGGEQIDYLMQHYLNNTENNIVSNDGLSTLHIACSRPNAQIVERLILSDYRLIDQAVDVTMRTPLHYAVGARRHQVVSILLYYGANICKQDSEGSTPLHWALWVRDVEMINLVLSYDTRQENITNKFGLSHFMVSCAGSDLKVVKEYIQQIWIRKVITIEEVMKSQISILGSYSGYTPLHFAVEFGSNIAIVRLLLQHGADCCRNTCYRISPHYLAALKGHKAIYELLMLYCCNIRN
ncbi:ankyrin-3-like isoform X2 [Phymastichus coffea]|nr:ankyrin-3-like isoform X2 [Phymastichus coffea]